MFLIKNLVYFVLTALFQGNIEDKKGATRSMLQGLNGDKCQLLPFLHSVLYPGRTLALAVFSTLLLLDYISKCHNVLKQLYPPFYWLSPIFDQSVIEM